MKIGLIYFSPTENTAKIAEIVKNKLDELHNEVEEFNITNYSERQKKIDLGQFEAIIFGFPIYYWRAPRLIRDWLLTLKGESKKSSVFFTYGGVNVGLAHHNIKNILTNQNFLLVSTAEFVGKHTYNLAGWNLNKSRPNQEDFEIAKDYTVKTYKRFIGEDTGTVSFKPSHINEEAVDRIEIMLKKEIPIPFREEECNMCRTCEELCPANAMDADKGKPNKRTCIRCLRCVANCPDNVLKTQNMLVQYQLIKKATKFTDEILNSRKSKILL